MASHEHYYVPAQSKWPIIATIGMFITVFGLGTWFNDMKAGHPDSHGPLIFFVGALFLAWLPTRKVLCCSPENPCSKGVPNVFVWSRAMCCKRCVVVCMRG